MRAATYRRVALREVDPRAVLLAQDRRRGVDDGLSDYLETGHQLWRKLFDENEQSHRQDKIAKALSQRGGG